jgi:hypothetical protein
MPRQSNQDKKKEPQKPRLVIVVWHDAFDGHPGWVDMDEYKPKAMEPLSVGWLIPDFMEDHITLMGSYMIDKNDSNSVHYSTPSHIPIGMIQSITYLDVPYSIRRTHNV